MPAKPPLLVSVSDAAVRKLIPVYLERRQADILKLSEALAGGDFSAIAAIGHGLKGSGGLYGLSPISDFGGRLEAAAQASDRNAAEDALAAMKDYLDRLEIQA